MKKKRTTLKITRLLLITDVLIWLSFSLVIAFGLHPAIPEGPLYRWGTAALALLTGLGITGLYLFLLKGFKPAYYLLLVGILIISFLTITDEFGLPDMIVLIINVAAFVLLIKDRKTYLIQ